MAVAAGGFSAVLTPFFALRPFGRRVPALSGVFGALDGQQLLLIEGSRAQLVSSIVCGYAW